MRVSRNLAKDRRIHTGTNEDAQERHHLCDVLNRYSGAGRANVLQQLLKASEQAVVRAEFV